MARTIVGVLAGIVSTLLIVLGAAGQSGTVAAVVQPFVVNVSQAVPVDLTVAVTTADGEEITVTAPITVGIDLQVQIDGPGRITVDAGEVRAAAVSVEPVDTGAENTDDLGIPYTIELDSHDVAIVEWTTYADTNDQFNISGVVRQLAGTDLVSDIVTTVRFYDHDGNLIAVDDVLNVAYRLQPGGTSRFDYHARMSPDEIGRYELEFQVVR
jgi:hypothetical protein